MPLVIRRYRPSDRDAVRSLFSVGIREHIWPCFEINMKRPLYISITVALCIAGYHISSLIGAVLLPGLWIGLVYYSGHEVYTGFVRNHLRTDMQDIHSNYLSRPDDCFFVAETEFDGLVQVVGTVAVLCSDNDEEKHGELLRMIVSPSCRRAGLGLRMVQHVVDFCKERGFSKVVLVTSSTQQAAVSLYKKLGFNHVPSKIELECPLWIEIVSSVTTLKMEMQLT